MPKIVPRQFYNTSEIKGMKLRSGKTINCIKTTEFGRDYSDLLGVFNLCSQVTKQFGENTTSTNQWVQFYSSLDLTVLRSDWTREFAFLLKMNGPVHYSVGCTIKFTINNFLMKWRKTVNSVEDMHIKWLLMEKLEQCVAEIEDRLTWAYWPDYCACHEPYTQVKEETIRDHFLSFGPGYLADRQWHFTPEVSREEFEARWQERKKTWTHSLPQLKDLLKDHLGYFKRVPHRFHQEVYYSFSSSSKRIPDPCSLNIISFV